VDCTFKCSIWHVRSRVTEVQLIHTEVCEQYVVMTLWLSG